MAVRLAVTGRFILSVHFSPGNPRRLRASLSRAWPRATPLPAASGSTLRRSWSPGPRRGRRRLHEICYRFKGLQHRSAVNGHSTLGENPPRSGAMAKPAIIWTLAAALFAACVARGLKMRDVKRALAEVLWNTFGASFLSCWRSAQAKSPAPFLWNDCQSVEGRSSFSTPRITTFKPSSGNGRCSAFASSHRARVQTSHSSSVVRITGIALGWIGSTIAFGAVFRNP